MTIHFSQFWFHSILSCTPCVSWLLSMAENLKHLQWTTPTPGARFTRWKGIASCPVCRVPKADAYKQFALLVCSGSVGFWDWWNSFWILQGCMTRDLWLSVLVNEWLYQAEELNHVSCTVWQAQWCSGCEAHPVTTLTQPVVVLSMAWWVLYSAAEGVIKQKLTSTVGVQLKNQPSPFGAASPPFNMPIINSLVRSCTNGWHLASMASVNLSFSAASRAHIIPSYSSW